jgi:DNA/RNA-binding domain of Phe-tRNA-synthetase-like protein
MTILSVSPKIFETFPGTLLGVVIFENINNHGSQPEISAALCREELRVVGIFQGISVHDHPQVAVWREAYRKFGAKPKDYPSSIENLARRVVKGHSVAHINLVVDLYNLISLRYLVPAGGEDLDRIQGDVELTFAGEEEAPVRMLGEAEEHAPKPGEVIYKDRTGAICRRWNWKEAERTKFSEDSTNGFLVIEGLPPVDKVVVEKAIDNLSALVDRYCGGKVASAIIDISNPGLILRA